MALSPVIVSWNCRSARSPQKTYTRSTRFLCRTCGGGVCGSLHWGLGSGDCVGTECIIQKIPAACRAFLDFAAADHRASIQFLFAFRQSNDITDWATHLCAAIYVDCVCVPAG